MQVESEEPTHSSFHAGAVLSVPRIGTYAKIYCTGTAPFYKKARENQMKPNLRDDKLQPVGQSYILTTTAASPRWHCSYCIDLKEG